jgi:hypothetical protein
MHHFISITEAITFSNKGITYLRIRILPTLHTNIPTFACCLIVHLLSIMNVIQAPHLTGITFFNARYNRVQDRDGDYTETIARPLIELKSIKNRIIKLRLAAAVLMPRKPQKSSSISTLDVIVKHELALFRSSNI